MTKTHTVYVKTKYSTKVSVSAKKTRPQNFPQPTGRGKTFDIHNFRGEVLHWDLVGKGGSKTESQTDVGIDGKGQGAAAPPHLLFIFLKNKSSGYSSWVLHFLGVLVGSKSLYNFFKHTKQPRKGSQCCSLRQARHYTNRWSEPPVGLNTKKLKVGSDVCTDVWGVGLFDLCVCVCVFFKLWGDATQKFFGGLFVLPPLSFF